MKKNLILLFTFNLLTFSQLGIAAVPNTFTAGQPAVASEVNENFSELDSRLQNIEASRGDTTFSWTTYKPTFSRLGQPKNVAIVKYNKRNSLTDYDLRLYYQNDSESVSSTIPAYIEKRINIEVDYSDGQNPVIKYISGQVLGYEQYNNLSDGRSSVQDNLSFSTPTSYSVSESKEIYNKCRLDGFNRYCYSTVVHKGKGAELGLSYDPTTYSVWKDSIIEEFKKYTDPVSGHFLGKVAFSYRDNNGYDNLQLRLENMGYIGGRTTNYDEEMFVIYYRLEGVEHGVLDSPFAQGGDLYGIFFTPN